MTSTRFFAGAGPGSTSTAATAPLPRSTRPTTTSSTRRWGRAWSAVPLRQHQRGRSPNAVEYPVCQRGRSRPPGLVINLAKHRIRWVHLSRYPQFDFTVERQWRTRRRGSSSCVMKTRRTGLRVPANSPAELSPAAAPSTAAPHDSHGDGIERASRDGSKRRKPEKVTVAAAVNRAISRGCNTLGREGPRALPGRRGFEALRHPHLEGSGARDPLRPDRRGSPLSRSICRSGAPSRPGWSTTTNTIRSSSPAWSRTRSAPASRSRKGEDARALFLEKVREHLYPKSPPPLTSRRRSPPWPISSSGPAPTPESPPSSPSTTTTCWSASSPGGRLPRRRSAGEPRQEAADPPPARLPAAGRRGQGCASSSSPRTTTTA